MKLTEQTGFVLLAAGGVIAAVGLIWLLARLLPVLREAVARGGRPFLVVLLGAAVAASPVVLNRFAPPDDKARAEVKPDAGGETRLTLTGANPAEYDKLNADKSFAVVQWANADVTDAHLEALRGMDNLRELDLNGSQVTDAGLAVLAALPKLETLRLARTKITDAGFRAHLLPLARLRQLDLTGTDVKGPTGREWKAAGADRQLVR